MCGIALATTKEECERMLEILAHRGRDDRQIVKVKDWWLGFNRLAIVDRNNFGKQPYVDYEGTAIAFNGEIYNYREVYPSAPSEIMMLAELLDTHKDFERVVDGYYGIVRVAPSEDKITLARDLFGVIPLYYVRVAGRLYAAASEKKALQRMGPILEVHAGETYEFSMDGRCAPPKRWDPFSLHFETVDMEHVQFLFERAVNRRMVHADVPITFALSGGLDSALVLWAARAINRQLYAVRHVTAVTVGVDPNSDEVKNAKALADICGAKWKFVQLTKAMVDEHRERIKYHLEDDTPNPIKWRGMLRNYFVAMHAPGTVILCGEGADEIGCGYPSHASVLPGLDLEWKSLSTVHSMPAINLDRVNKGGMAWTKEFRVPFLDRALVLYLMGCRKEPGKGIFKRMAMRMGLPDFILTKPKYGEEEKRLEELAGFAGA